MRLRVGLALVSAADTTNVIVTVAPDGEVELTCGGVPMVEKGVDVPAAQPDPDALHGSLIGKRYVDPAGTIEVLCTKAGEGSLALDDVRLSPAQAKSLPASD